MEQAAAADAVTMTVTHSGRTRVQTWRGESAAEVFAKAEAAWHAADDWLRGAFPVLRREPAGGYSAAVIVYSAE
jgi:hypothetical protein